MRGSWEVTLSVEGHVSGRRVKANLPETEILFAAHRLEAINRNAAAMDSPPSPFDIPFDRLPNPKQVWVGAPGSQEEGLGKLGLLTPEVVANAAKEIKTGRRVTLGWEMTKLELANLNRHPCQHHIISLLNGLAFDDIYVFNPRRYSIVFRIRV